jgi:hypothetical protein
MEHIARIERQIKRLALQRTAVDYHAWLHRSAIKANREPSRPFKPDSERPSVQRLTRCASSN